MFKNKIDILLNLLDESKESITSKGLDLNETKKLTRIFFSKKQFVSKYKEEKDFEKVAKNLLKHILNNKTTNDIELINLINKELFLNE